MGNDGCCTSDNKCGDREGDCDFDSDCISGVCGSNNCPWGDSDDCCIGGPSGSETPNSISLEVNSGLDIRHPFEVNFDPHSVMKKLCNTIEDFMSKAVECKLASVDGIVDMCNKIAGLARAFGSVTLSPAKDWRPLFDFYPIYSDSLSVSFGTCNSMSTAVGVQDGSCIYCDGPDPADCTTAMCESGYYSFVDGKCSACAKVISGNVKDGSCTDCDGPNPGDCAAATCLSGYHSFDKGKGCSSLSVEPAWDWLLIQAQKRGSGQSPSRWKRCERCEFLVLV